MVPGSRAQEVVYSYPQLVDNYAKAISALKQRFGKEELLVEVYVQKLLKLVINITQGEKQCVSKMSNKLETQLRSLESLRVTSDKYASMLYPLVESSLPEDNLRAWQRSPLSAKDGTKKDPSKSRSSIGRLMGARK